jgi:hypothetical protein
MTADDRQAVPLRQFFEGLAEYAFESRLGVADPPLVDYMADLLARFIQMDAVYTVRSITGRRMMEVSDMLAEAQMRVGSAQREIHRHIGDFTLFWTGLYPESLLRMRSAKRKDYMVDYHEEGKRAYYIASTIPAEDDPPGNEVLERLSHEFDVCVQGLTEVRREWEQRDPSGMSRLLWLN